MSQTHPFQFSVREKNPIKSLLATIKQQKDMIRSLAHQLEVCRVLSDEAADAICTVDLKGRLTYANKAQADLVKVPLSKIKGTHFRRYVDPVSLGKAYKFFKLAKNGKKIRDELNVVDSKGNLIPVDFHTTPLYKNRKVFAIHTIIRDISKRKQFERLQIEAAKTQAMNHFIAGMAKEVKYPLEVIVGRLENISRNYRTRDFEYIGYKEFKQIMGTIEHLNHEVKYCCSITNRMIDLNRKNLGISRSVCDVNKAVGKAVDLLDEKILRPHTKVSLKLSSRLPPGAISELELSQVVTNILTNAVESMPTGGTVRGGTSYDKGKKRIALQIKDQGIGIKKENLPRVFEPFFTTKQTGFEKNSGLGLAIAHSIVHAHQGNVTVSSNLRQGTVFVVELPVARK